MTDMHESDLSTSSSDVFVSSELSNLTLRCGLDVYKLHRAILSEHSSFFARLCDGNVEVRNAFQNVLSSCLMRLLLLGLIYKVTRC